MNQHTHFINGQWVTGSGREFSSQNPATLAEIWRGNAAEKTEVNAAVAAARAAFPAWFAASLEDRLHYLETFKALVEHDKNIFIETLCEDTGKARWDAAGEIMGMIGKLAVSVDAYRERTGTREGTGAGFKTSIHHAPLGVVAVYGPYNFPAHLPNGHIMPALLAGNTVIFKPSEMTPKIAELMLRYWQRAGIPDGVINLVQGERETGQLLAEHAGIDGLFFTGSSATGEILARQFADKPGKMLALELGGNNPMVVHNTQDIRAAVFHIVQSAFMTTGQRCSCTRRLILTPDVDQKSLLSAIVEAAKTLQYGAYNATPEPYMGPIISGREVEKLLTAQADLIKMGAKPLLEMTRPDPQKWFLTPAILDVTGMDAPDREYFGPILQVIRVPDFDAAIAAANNTEYGLTAGLISDAREDYNAFLHRVRAGVINWNRPTTGASANAPFGGMGRSGNLRPAAYYAADYCAHPVASSYEEKAVLPATLPPGLSIE